MRLILAAAACTLAVLPAAAKTAAGTADQVIARSGSTSFTADQLRALVAALPDDSRAKVVSDPAALAELLRSAVLQNELLADARAKGWDRRPEVAAEIERARQAIIVRGFVASQVPPPAAPTDAQISAAYDANKARFMLPRQYHLAQIFVAVPATDTPDQIDRVRARLAGLRIALSGKPAEFAETAKRLSDDKRSAPGGGDLGWLREDALAEPIKTAVAGLPEGSVSDPLRTPDGWHLIELITTRPAGPAPLEQVKPALVQAIQQQERQAATRAYLDAQLKRDPVEINEVALSDRQIRRKAMKGWLALVLLLPATAAAQGLVLGTDPPPAPAGDQCTTVSSGTATSFGCINAQEKALVAQQKANTDAAGFNQNSAPPRLGLYNQAATKEHLGDNFGHSVYPQQLPPPNYRSPLIPPK